MIDVLSSWWNRNGFMAIILGCIIFFVVCWLFGWKSKKGTAGNIKDYLFDMLVLSKPKKKRNAKKTENYCRSIVEDIFQVPFPSVRPDMLKNPATGRNMECDMMNPELKLCIERQGEQHTKEVKHFQSGDDFQKQQQRDQLKRELLKKAGYTLIEIPYTVHYDVLHQYIPEVISRYPQFKSYVDRYRQK